MSFKKKLYENARKPEGLMGHYTLARMNRRHAKLSDWGLAHLKLFSPLAIAELGCGGGRNTEKLMRMFPQAKMYALDYSPTSVAKTEKRCAGAVREKRLEVVQGNVVSLPWPADTLDMATAFETVYYWPGPVESFREVCRVLRPGGIFMVVNEDDGENPDYEKWQDRIDEMRLFDKMTLIRTLKDAGFSEFSVDHDEARHWLCVMARK